jgi:hypothetical protein
MIGQNVIWVKYIFNCVYLPRPEKKGKPRGTKRRRTLRLKVTFPRAPISSKGIKRSAQKVLHSKNPKGGVLV